MRALFVSPLYPSSDAPEAGAFVREHALAAAQHAEVVVVHGPLYAPHRRGASLLETGDVIDGALPTYTFEHGPSPLPKTHRVHVAAAAWRAAGELERRHGPFDIVHANLFRAGLAAAVMARRWSAPMVLSEHLSDLPRGLLSPRDALEASLAYRLAHTVLPVSRALARALSVHNMRVVPNAVDPTLFHPPPRRSPAPPFRLLTVGGLRWVKGLDVLWPALARLNEHRRDWVLDVVGDGPEGDHHRDAIARHALGAQVRLLGWRRKPEVAELMREAHLFVLPSLWENLPCALIEALASGLPAVASRVGGIPEVLTSDDGVLVPARSSTALADAIVRQLDELHRYDAAAMHQRAIERFGRAVVAEQLHQVYNDALSGRSPA